MNFFFLFKGKGLQFSKAVLCPLKSFRLGQGVFIRFVQNQGADALIAQAVRQREHIRKFRDGRRISQKLFQAIQQRLRYIPVRIVPAHAVGISGRIGNRGRFVFLPHIDSQNDLRTLRGGDILERVSEDHQIIENESQDGQQYHGQQPERDP